MTKRTRITGGPRRARVRHVHHAQLLGRDELTTLGRLRYGASVGELVLVDDGIAAASGRGLDGWLGS